MSITGEPGRGPMRVGIPVADLCAGIFCSQGILLALMERERSGKGQWVQTSLLQAQVFMLDFQASRWLMDGDVPGQAGNDHPTSIPTGVFKTSDGYINLGVAGQAIWLKFKEHMQRPGLRRPRFRRRQIALEKPQEAERSDRQPYDQADLGALDRHVERGRRPERRDQ